jgi:hypothetical protein
MPRKPRREVSLEAKKEKEMENPLDGKKDDQNVWVENLKTGDSVYRSDRSGDAFPMSGNGLAGSVISVPVKVAKEAYFRRSVSRGAIKLLTDGEADQRESELVFVDDSDAEVDRTMEALEKGASESGSRYKNKNLSDDGTEGTAIPARQVWKRESTKGPSTVRRSDATAPAIPLSEVPDGPIPAVITETVREGEWQSDTGSE